MARKQSSLKARRVSERRHIRNRSVRSALRTHVRKARGTVDGRKLEEAPVLVRVAVSQLDRAAHKGIVHPNQAARRKSRLMRRLAAALAAQQAVLAQPEPEAVEPKPRRARRAPAATQPAAAPRTRRAAAATEAPAAPRTRRPRASPSTS